MRSYLEHLHSSLQVLNAIFKGAHERRSSLLFTLPASVFASENSEATTSNLLYSSREDWLAEMKQCEIVSELENKWTIIDQRVDKLCE